MPKGQITSKDLIITAIITLGIAIVIIALFIVLAGKENQGSQDASTLELINQIKQQAAQENDIQKQPQTPNAQTDVEEKESGTNTITMQGALTVISGDVLTIIDETTKAQTQILLTKDTVAVYNGSVFAKKDFYTGDLLTIQAAKVGDIWEAVSIVVRFSASPDTAAPVPQGLEERPDGSLKPLGNS